MAQSPFERIMDGAKFVDDWNQEHASSCFLTMVCMPTGIALKATYQIGQNHYTQENLTPWNGIAQARDNPLAQAINSLLEKTREHQHSNG